MSKNLTAIFLSDVKDGRLQKTASRNIAAEIQRHEGKRIEIKIRRVSSKRSLPQNAYLHLLFTLFTNELNALGNTFTMIEVKELLKTKFATIDVINESTGEVIGQRVKGTSEMSKGEMIEFIDNIIRYGKEIFNFNLPYPNESMTFEFND